MLRWAFAILLSSISTFHAGGCLAQSANTTFWDAEKLAASASSTMRLRKNTASEEVVATVQVARVRLLVDAKNRIEKEAGLAATLRLTDMGMPHPNAFSTRTDKGGFVGVNLAMLDLLGDDVDALAAVVGHEYAHLALDHRSARQNREAGRQVIGTILGLLLGRYGVPMGGTIADLGTSMVARTFSREEEREADEKGIHYAAAAGFSVEGGIRAWERMASHSRNRPNPFLATHPAPEERIETMRQLALAIPSRPAQPVDSASSQSVAELKSDEPLQPDARELLSTATGGRLFLDRVISQTDEEIELLTVHERDDETQTDRWGLNCRKAVAYWKGYEIASAGKPAAQTDIPSPIAFHYSKVVEHGRPESLNSYHVLKLCDRLSP